jgi:hypothetical protein
LKKTEKVDQTIFLRQDLRDPDDIREICGDVESKKTHVLYDLRGQYRGSDNICAHLKKSQTDSFSFNLAKSYPKITKPLLCGMKIESETWCTS